MTILSYLKTGGRAAVVALTLGAASLAAMPAQAASGPSFNFQLGIGSDGGYSGFEFGKKKFKPIKICLTNRQVERALEDYGFDDANVVKKLPNSKVVVIARWDWRYYSMKVNKCSGQVYEIHRLKKGYDYFPGNQHGGMGYEKDGFSFQFNF